MLEKIWNNKIAQLLQNGEDANQAMSMVAVAPKIETREDNGAISAWEVRS